MLDFEFVLQEDEIALTVFVGHFCFEGRAEGVEGDISGCDCFGREEIDPAEAFEDAVFFVSASLKEVLEEMARSDLVRRTSRI